MFLLWQCGVMTKKRHNEYKETKPQKRDAKREKVKQTNYRLVYGLSVL